MKKKFLLSLLFIANIKEINCMSRIEDRAGSYEDSIRFSDGEFLSKYPSAFLNLAGRTISKAIRLEYSTEKLIEIITSYNMSDLSKLSDLELQKIGAFHFLIMRRISFENAELMIQLENPNLSKKEKDQLENRIIKNVKKQKDLECYSSANLSNMINQPRHMFEHPFSDNNFFNIFNQIQQKVYEIKQKRGKIIHANIKYDNTDKILIQFIKEIFSESFSERKIQIFIEDMFIEAIKADIFNEEYLNIEESQRFYILYFNNPKFFPDDFKQDYPKVINLIIEGIFTEELEKIVDNIANNLRTPNNLMTLTLYELNELYTYNMLLLFRYNREKFINTSINENDFKILEKKIENAYNNIYLTKLFKKKEYYNCVTKIIRIGDIHKYFPNNFGTLSFSPEEKLAEEFLLGLREKFPEEKLEKKPKEEKKLSLSKQTHYLEKKEVEKTI